jgi:hypothetical protein
VVLDIFALAVTRAPVQEYVGVIVGATGILVILFVRKESANTVDVPVAFVVLSKYTVYGVVVVATSTHVL